jgi:hypothetical protein
MGWTYTYMTDKKQFIAERTSNQENDTSKYEVIGYSLVGNNLWIAYNHTNKISNTTKQIIYLDRIGKDDGQWCYKDIGTEDHGLLDFNCPLKLINKTSGTGTKESIEWRNQVVKYHENLKSVDGLVGGLLVNLNDNVSLRGQSVVTASLMYKDKRTWVARFYNTQGESVGIALLPKKHIKIG